MNNHPLAWGTIDGPKQDDKSWAYRMAREEELWHKHWNAVRLDDQKRVDDVAVSCDLGRLERMDEDCFWLAFYRGRKRICFSLTSESTILADVTEDDLDTYDDSKPTTSP